MKAWYDGIRIKFNCMSLKQQIIDDFKKAFKEKDAGRKSVLSMINSEIKNQEIALGTRESGLSDDEVQKIVLRAIKQRKDSMEQFEKGGRAELAENEKKEAVILEKYLPEQLGDDELEKVVTEVIEKMGAENKADLGKVMGGVMAELKGKADGNRVREVAERLLV